MNKSGKGALLGKDSWLEKLACDQSSLRTKGNVVDLYFEGDEAFDSMREAIRFAERFVHMEMYMFNSDRIGREIAEELSAKAKSGIPVRIVYDAIGSSDADEEMFESMLESGVQAKVFRPVAPWRKRSGLMGRNHRKNLIIDGRFAFTGGMNLGEVWSRKYGPEVWRDTHLRLEGPAAAACEVFFLQAWEKVGGGMVEESPFYQLDDTGPGTSDCVVVGNRGVSDRRAIRHLYSEAMEIAQENVEMTVPYFVPPKRVMKVMQRRAAENVRVRVLVPRNSDVALADWLREGLYPSLMEYGVEIYEYVGSVLHAKSVVFDEQLAVVGSANFDYLSISFNWELAVVIDDQKVVNQLRGAFETDLEQSEKVESDWASSRPWWRRVLAWIGSVILREL